MTTFRSDAFAVAICPEQSEGLSFIEQLQKMCLLECTAPKRPFLSGRSEKQKTVLLTHPACKMWSCKACSARNARRWIARIINGVNKMDTENSWFMFTLTAHEKWRGKVRSVANLRQGWKKLYNRIRYEFKINHYCKVWEMHTDGSFHLHGLIDSVIAQKWLKDNARECGMGYQVDIHEVDNAGQVAGYIAKYFLKSESTVSELNPHPKNLRRIEVSRSWLKLPKLNGENAFDWILHKSREGQLRLADYYENCHNYQILDLCKT